MQIFSQNKDVGIVIETSIIYKLICSSICGVAVYHVKLKENMLDKVQNMIHDYRK